MKIRNTWRKKGKLIHIRLSPLLHHKLKIHTATLGITLQSWTVRTIRNALRKQKRKLKTQEEKPNEPTINPG